jgi:hypothetical protein
MLQKFGMMDSKPMTTPMITNLKKLRSSDSSLVDPTSYRKLVGSLMYLVNTRPDICFVVNVLSQFRSMLGLKWIYAWIDLVDRER